MNKLIYEMIPILLSLTISQIAYLKIDKKYGVSNKVGSKIGVQDKWKPCFCICSAFMIIMIVGVLNIYVIDIPVTIYFIFSGTLFGIVIGLANKLTIKKVYK